MAGALARALAGLSAASNRLPAMMSQRYQLEQKAEEQKLAARNAAAKRNREGMIAGLKAQLEANGRAMKQVDAAIENFAGMGTEGGDDAIPYIAWKERLIAQEHKLVQEIVQVYTGQAKASRPAPLGGPSPMAPTTPGPDMGPTPGTAGEAPSAPTAPAAPSAAAAPSAPTAPLSGPPPMGGAYKGMFAKRQAELDEKAAQRQQAHARTINMAYGQGKQDIEEGAEIGTAMATYKSMMPGMSEEHYADVRKRFSDVHKPLAETEEQWRDLAFSVAQNKAMMALIPKKDVPKLFMAMGKAGLIYEAPITEQIAIKLVEMDTAIYELGSLTGAIEERPDLMGPFVAKAYPLLYGTQIRKDAKALDAQLAKAKQIIAKGMEGGVLRAEDERKYDRILATLSDEPELALMKVKGVLESIIYKRERYLHYLKSAGYYQRSESIPNDVYESLGLGLPVDPTTSTFETMMTLLPEFPELLPHIEKQYPDELSAFEANQEAGP